MPSSEFMKMVHDAYGDELEAVDIYTRMAQIAPTDAVRRAILQISRDEMRHAYFFGSLLSLMGETPTPITTPPGTMWPPATPAPAPEPYPVMPGPMEPMPQYPQWPCPGMTPWPTPMPTPTPAPMPMPMPTPAPTPGPCPPWYTPTIPVYSPCPGPMPPVPEFPEPPPMQGPQPTYPQRGGRPCSGCGQGLEDD